MDTTGEDTSGSSTNESGANATSDRMRSQDEAGGGGASQLRTFMERAMHRVEASAKEKPMAMLAMASGVGYVLGRGLPRLGMLALLGGGGLVAGLGIPALRRRLMGAQNESEAEDDPRESLDVGGSTGPRSRRKTKAQHSRASA